MFLGVDINCIDEDQFFVFVLNVKVFKEVMDRISEIVMIKVIILGLYYGVYVKNCFYLKLF